MQAQSKKVQTNFKCALKNEKKHPSLFSMHIFGAKIQRLEIQIK